MNEALADLKQYVGKSEMATDVVTASAIVKLAATLGFETPASAKGDEIPPGWQACRDRYGSVCEVKDRFESNRQN